jgi:hypothetical protein
MHKLDPSSLSAQHVSDITSISDLAGRSKEEINRYQRGDSVEDSSTLQMLSLARLHNDEQTWRVIEQCFAPLALSWIRRHPRYEEACRVKTERRYLMLTLNRFKHGLVEQNLTFSSLAGVVRYVQVCVNSVLLDTVRSAAWLEKINQHELLISTNGTDQCADAALLQRLLSDEREQRLAYLLFHCGLSPREIVQTCPSEFADLEEIYQLRRSLMAHLQASGELSD